MGESSEIRVRFPTIELFAARSGGFLASQGRSLTRSERQAAFFIFYKSINLDAVRIVRSAVANAPATLGNHIRVAPGASMNRATLIHELTHVWQYQTQGMLYVSDSIYHQTRAFLTTGSRGAAYRYTIVPGQSIRRYTAEHQAMIVQTYFANPSVRTNRDYERMIGEVRRARPLPASAILEEAAFGANRNAFQMPEPGRPLEESRRMIPIIRWEF